MVSEADWLTCEEAAGTLRVSVQTVSRYIRKGHLNAAQLPGRRGVYRIPRSEIDRLLTLPVSPSAQNDPAGSPSPPPTSGSFCGGDGLPADVRASA